MKNTNALQVFSIISVIIIIILGVVLIMFNNASTEQIAQMNAAIDKAKKADTEKAAALQENITLKELIGHKDEVDAKTIQDEFNKDIEKYAKGGAKNYRQALSYTAAELAKKNEEHKNTNDSLNKKTADYDNLHALYETVLEKNAAEKQKAIEDLVGERKAFSDSKNKIESDMKEIAAERDRAKQEAEQQIKKAEEDKEEATIKANQIGLRNEELAGVIADIRRDSFERPSGKIVSINQKSGLVIIDLGKEDGLMTRMTFSVYNPKITGIAFGSAKFDEESQICEVCKRELKQNASKASIEVVKILGPHKSEARILDDELVNPIVAGDVIHTPIWKPGQHQRFALAAGMRLPGVENRDGDYSKNNLEAIKRLIAANGGIVDAYISDRNDGEQKQGDIVGKITRDTTYLVTGALNEDDQNDQETMKAQSTLTEQAKQLAVKQISLLELLSRMGYKNTTPVRGFGSYASSEDQHLTPTGESRPSTGTVSPLYQLPNNEARVTIEDRKDRPSTGKVSGLYDGAKSTQSTGSVSELFRQRKPGVESSVPTVEDENKPEKPAEKKEAE
jgi:hypothetical protein